MKLKIFKSFIVVGLIGSTIIACTQEKEEDTKSVDQSAFLANTAELIFSSYQAFNISVNQLNESIDSLVSKPNNANLIATKNNLKTAYLSWQTVNFYEFGPAETASLKSSINVYKTDTAQIDANILSGNYNLDQIAMKDAKGFPALDYLLNSKSESFIINWLMTNNNASNYLKAVSGEIKSKVNQVSNDWSSYKNTFSTATGTDIGSSTGTLVNALNRHFEQFFRDNKIGIPLGIRSSGIARPDFVEAIYGQYSLELVLKNFKAMKTLYTGNGAYGLDDYLNDSDAGDLNSRIADQMQLIALKLNVLSGPLPQQIQNNPNQVQEAYNEMQKLIVLWKVDMPSRIGVLISYQDNDGD